MIIFRGGSLQWELRTCNTYNIMNCLRNNVRSDKNNIDYSKQCTYIYTVWSLQAGSIMKVIFNIFKFPLKICDILPTAFRFLLSNSRTLMSFQEMRLQCELWTWNRGSGSKFRIRSNHRHVHVLCVSVCMRVPVLANVLFSKHISLADLASHHHLCM